MLIQRKVALNSCQKPFKIETFFYLFLKNDDPHDVLGALLEGGQGIALAQDGHDLTLEGRDSEKNASFINHFFR